MNYSIIRYIIFKVLTFTALFLAIPCIVAAIYGEDEGIVYATISVIVLLIGLIGTRFKPKNSAFYAKEGFVTVALSWIILSLIGALPFVITGEIPKYVDAVFETVSGFTTTGASILPDVEALSYTSLFWRSFTHWVGGMGVLVFILAVTPLTGGYNIHLMKAESPGPSVGKLVPKIKQTSMILYGIYFAMTIVQIVLLLIAGMPAFDAVTLSMGTAGTGGFGTLNTSIMNYSTACQAIITIFMILFGVNFTVYYLLLMKKWKQVLKCEEVRWYFIIITVSVVLIAINLGSDGGTVFERVHHAAFQVGSIITTTGYSTVDFNNWPALSQTILVVLMFVGACAGSTGGGIKVSRIVSYFKIARNEIHLLLHPKRVKSIQLEGKTLSDATVKSMQAYLITFMFLFVLSVGLVSLDGFDLVTNITAVAATINNIGPGLSLVGPTENFAKFSDFSTVVMSMTMLVGRLEIFPILVLFSPSTWIKGR